MTRWVSAVMGIAVALSCSVATAQQKVEKCDTSRTAERLAGQVVSVNASQGRVTVRGDDGTTHEFEASRETVQDMKVGDRIEAKLRSAPKC